ncbi:MAG: Iron(III) transport system substrate-binding protein [Hyphomicrobiales bacterium]|nr:Iron(III) transport system substrate-binding protein [Hyphomicrobiales bacterium]
MLKTAHTRSPLAALAATLLSLALPAPAAAQTSAPAAPEDWDQVVAAAKKEGKVVVYSAYVSPNTHKAIGDAFEKAYGIKVEYLMARGTEIRERTRVEHSAGRFLGDVSHNALSQHTTGFIGDGSLQKLAPMPGTARLKPEFASRVDGFTVPVFTINYGFLVNTSVVKPQDEPKGWRDLLDPKWKGRILSDDPRASGGGRVMFHMTYDKWGREFHEKLAAQNLTFSRDYNEATRRVARGEFAIYIPLILGDYAKIKGLPVKYVMPSEGSTYGSYSVGIFRNAPHPNAARLMLNFYFSDEAQAVYARDGHGIVIKDLKADLPEEARALSNVKPLVDEDFTRIQEMYDRAKEIYK